MTPTHRHSIWHIFWQSIWHCIWPSIWHMIWYPWVIIFYLAFYLTFYLTYVLTSICSGPGVHCKGELAIWLGADGAHTHKLAQRPGERVAPLPKSRDPHLAGGEKNGNTYLTQMLWMPRISYPPYDLLSCLFCVSSWVNLLQRAFKKGHSWRSKAACFFKSCHEKVQHHRQKAKAAFLLHYHIF